MRQHLRAARNCRELLYVKSSEFDWNGHGQNLLEIEQGLEESRGVAKSCKNCKSLILLC